MNDLNEMVGDRSGIARDCFVLLTCDGKQLSSKTMVARQQHRLFILHGHTNGGGGDIDIDPSSLILEDSSIGEGKSGVIYNGKLSCPSDCVDVAVKCYRLNRLSRKDKRNMLKEVDILSRLDHPNIATYYGACIAKKAIVMECAGFTEHIENEAVDIRNVRDLLDECKESVEIRERLSIPEDIAKGIAYLHDNGVIHRDLKSTNILLTKEQELLRAKVCSENKSSIGVNFDPFIGENGHCS